MLGAIADDVTGATDLASVLIRAGCRVVQTLGMPALPPPPADAIVVATKSRMAAPEEALAIARTAADFLDGVGADQLFFKYCSTFDSTARGNIGPVTDDLLDRLGSGFTVACPSYPTLGRTVFQGHLFVGDRLLSESSMRHHPLTPMTDSDLVRVLGAQTVSRVALADLAAVEAGPAALRRRLDALAAGGARMAIVDAVADRHLATIAKACRDMPLVTGGAALGGALGRVRQGGAAPEPPVARDTPGPVAMLSGSCSAATLAQVEYIRGRVPSLSLDPIALAADPRAIERTIDWAVERARMGDFLLYSTADPARIAAAHAGLGREAAASAIEDGFAAVTRALADAGVRRFVVAGGETSGAVTQALGVSMMTFGAEIAPGVPVTYTLAPEGYALALKSGNFGGPDFFERAVAMT